MPTPASKGTGETPAPYVETDDPPPVPTWDTTRTVTAGEFALTETEIHRVLAGAGDFECEVLLRLAITTGIRREDLVSIRMEGVDLLSGRIRFRESKKSRQWEVPIGGETATSLRKWVGGLPARALWLFPSSHGPAGHKTGHRSGRWAYNIFQDALDRAGLARRPFHALRATCIKLCQRRGWSPEQVSRLTGDTIRVIQMHYSTPSRDEMAEVALQKPLL